MALIMRHTMTATMTAKAQYQYSDRRARPLKSAYLFSTVRIASVNDILVLLVGPSMHGKECQRSVREVDGGGRRPRLIPRGTVAPRRGPHPVAEGDSSQTAPIGSPGGDVQASGCLRRPCHTSPLRAPSTIAAAIAMNQVRRLKITPTVPYSLLSEVMVAEKYNAAKPSSPIQ